MSLTAWIALAIFLIAIVAVVANVIDSTVAALLGVVAMIVFGVMTEVEAHLLNVQVALRGDIGQFISHEQIAAYQHEEGEKALGEAQARLNAAAVRLVVHTEVGHVAEVIARLADELDCDHIVMGTHGRGALADLLAGSTTIRVVHLARMPVVLVK